MKRLDGKVLYYAFVSGTNEVMRQRDTLNKINVFPIADGDTGSNLVFTMRAMVEEAAAYTSAKRTMDSISDAALMGARGNSGIIFAQFVRGMNLGLGEVNDISVRDFANAAKRAVPYAYEAVANPTEGTILTVMQDWADSLNVLYDRAKDFEELLAKSLETVVVSLEDTTNKLRVLQKANVVDSGAKGFFHFLEGFHRFLQQGADITTLALDVERIEIEADEHYATADESITFRYCTEALLSGHQLDVDAVKSFLGPLGDSLIVAGHESKLRIHLHTDQPEMVMLKLRGFGSIVQQKVDDMRRQSDTIHHRKGAIALVTDSIADIPQEWLDREQIHMQPLHVMMEGSAYVDRLTITSNKIYALLDSIAEYPTSAQPNQKSVEGLFSFLRQHYESIIVVSVSQELSGTFQTFTNAAKRCLEQGVKISIVDSKLNSGAQGLVVVAAAEAIAAGHDHDTVVTMINEYIARSKIFVSVHTLKYMLRSGRVSSTMAAVAKFLNLKPVVSLDEQGKGSIFGKAFSARGNTKLIRRTVNKIHDEQGIAEYCIVHASAPERAAEYARIFTKMIGKEPKFITDVSAITALSAGVGSTGIALITR